MDVRTWFSRRALLLHLTVLTVVPTFLGLAWWQLHRALGGNELSWAYTFEWPFFAGYAVFVWWKLLHDQDVPFARRRQQPVSRPVGWALQGSTKAAGSAPTSPAPTSPMPTSPAPTSTPSASTAPAAAAASVPSTAPATASATATAAATATALDGAEPPMSDEDRALAEYNDYLAALAASGRRKTW